MQTAASRTRDEVIAMGVNAARQVSAQIRAPGGVWSSVAPSPLATVSESVWWGFDVAYESVSGDAMLVWNNGTTGTSGLSYRVWNGTAWSAPATITTPLAGEPQQLQLAANPTSDQMVLTVGTAGSNDYALVWDGVQWIPGDSLVLESAGRGNRTDTNVVYEAQSGDAIVTYRSGNGAIAEPVYYRVWNGSTWSAEASVAPPAGGLGHPQWTMVASDPGSDRLVMGVLTDSADIWLTTWNGSAWAAPTLASAKADSAAVPDLAVAFEPTSGEAIVTYAEAGKKQVRYRTWTVGGGWAAEVNGPNLGNTPSTMMLYPRPGTDDVMLGVLQASTQVADILWDGTGWSSIIDFDLTGETTTQPFSWVWR